MNTIPVLQEGGAGYKPALNPKKNMGDKMNEDTLNKLIIDEYEKNNPLEISRMIGNRDALGFVEQSRKTRRLLNDPAAVRHAYNFSYADKPRIYILMDHELKVNDFGFVEFNAYEYGHLSISYSLSKSDLYEGNKRYDATIKSWLKIKPTDLYENFSVIRNDIPLRELNIVPDMNIIPIFKKRDK